MSEYYNEKYQNYYNKLSSTKETSKVKYVSEETVNKLKSLQGQISSSNWNELAVDRIANGVIANISDDSKILDTNIVNSLNEARNMSYEKLLPELEKLKEKDEEYDKLLNTLRSTTDETTKQELTVKKTEMEKELKAYRNDVDNTISSIKKVSSIKDAHGSHRPVYKILSRNLTLEKDEDGRLVEMLSSTGALTSSMVKRSTTTSEKKTTETKTTSKKVEVEVPTSSKTVRLNTLGGNWKVVNTATSVTDYASTVAKNKICQTNDTSKYSDYCLAFSYVHASNMKNGQVDNAAAAGNYKHSGEFTTFVNDNKQVVLNKVYEEINKGNPVILQVNGNSKGTVRHFVTVVGYKDTVTSGSTITEDDLLILDSWDGQLERMDTSSSRFMTTGKACGKKDYSGYRLQVMK